MGVLRVDSSASTDRLIVTGDILALLENRRAARFLKDNTDYTLDGDTIVITVTDSLNKSIDRIKTAAKYAKCEVQLSQSADAGI